MMTRDEIIHGLEREVKSIRMEPQSKMLGVCITVDEAEDIVALLKEQEPVEPEVYFVGPDKYKFYNCPACKTAWYYKGNYCLGCGRAVKWNA